MSASKARGLQRPSSLDEGGASFPPLRGIFMQTRQSKAVVGRVQVPVPFSAISTGHAHPSHDHPFVPYDMTV